MTPESIMRLLEAGEGQTIEYKECVNELSNSVFETVCSFSNRYGGHLILGVTDKGDVLGVNRNAAPSMKKNFTNMLNNQQKISPSLFLNLDEVEVDGRLLLHVYIPISFQAELCSGKIYDRIGDADVDVTKSTERMAEIFTRKSSMYSEREIISFVTDKELRFDLVERAKKMAITHASEHPWANLSPQEMLRHSRLFEEDFRTGKKGYNLAAVLLFGRDDVIASCAPGYLTDALIRRDNASRYDNRITVGTNLIEAYDQLMNFIANHTLDRFFLMEDSRVSARTWIARELVSNILVHREYSKGFLARIIIEKDRIFTENWNRSNAHGRIDPNDFSPYAKNPLLSWFFVNIGRADYLGSGVKNLYKYTKMYSGGEPELIDGDIFKTIIPISAASPPYDDDNGLDATDTDGGLDGEGSDIDGMSIPSLIMKVLEDEPKATQVKIAELIGISPRTVSRKLKQLRISGRIQRIGSYKSGYWEIIK